MQEENIIQAHGSTRTPPICAKCGAEHDKEILEAHIREKKILRCSTGCGGPVKPDIVFFGEGLPHDFTSYMWGGKMNEKCDLMIVIGTALAVWPFNMVVDEVNCPQVLINLTNTANEGFDFEDRSQPDRLFWKGYCD